MTSETTITRANQNAISVRFKALPMGAAYNQRAHDYRTGVVPKYVDPARAELNSTLREGRPLPEIRDEIRALRKTNGAVRDLRSDAAIVTSGLVTFGVEAQRQVATLPVEVQDAAFRAVASALAQRLNTALEDCVVHRDETAVHCHTSMRAYTSEGIPVSKILSRAVCIELQDLAQTTMSAFLPMVERGHSRKARLESGAPEHEVINRSVRQLHDDLLPELAKAKADLAATNADKEAVAASVLTLRAEKAALEQEKVDADARAQRLAEQEAAYRQRMKNLEEREAAVLDRERAVAQKKANVDLVASSWKPKLAQLRSDEEAVAASRRLQEAYEKSLKAGIEHFLIGNVKPGFDQQTGQAVLEWGAYAPDDDCLLKAIDDDIAAGYSDLVPLLHAVDPEAKSSARSLEHGSRTESMR